MAGVTPRQIYTALIGAGATQVQAIGIMANGLAESGLDPEAVGDGGTSFGLWQQHGLQYSGLVTGNPASDMNAQVKVLAMNRGFAAASGTTAAEAAGNFSANYERCTTCQAGQASYNARVANAGIVAGWVTSGKWPSKAPASAAATGSGSGSSTGSDCAFGPKLPLVGQVCLVQRATIRHFAGVALMTSGGGVALAGVILLAAFAFRASGAQRAATQITTTFTPARGAAGRSAATTRAAPARSAGTAATGTPARQRPTRQGRELARNRTRIQRARTVHHEPRKVRGKAAPDMGELREVTPAEHH